MAASMGPVEPASPTASQLPPVPASPTCSYASTAHPISPYGLPLPPPPRPGHAVLTRADLDQSQRSYADLIAGAKTYRVALAGLSAAASSFGSALEACARLKEARADAIGPPAAASLSNSFNTKGSCTADVLLATAGLHHLVANHQQILSETVYRSFEVPLLHELDKWRRDVNDESETYERAVRDQSRAIRRLEKEGLKLHRQRRRDVAGFRSHLVALTTQLDGLTVLHADHARNLLRESQETSTKIVDAACSLVRAEVDIFEGLARKGWTGGGLEDVLERGADLFARDEDDGYGAGAGGGQDDTGSKLFSILPHKSILADAGSDTTRPGHTRAESLLGDVERYQSLAGAAMSPVKGGGGGGGGGGDTDSIFSEPSRPRGGGVRPFSPQPIRVDLNEALGEHLAAVAESSSLSSSSAAAVVKTGDDGRDRDRDKGTEEGIDDDEKDDDDDDDQATPRSRGFTVLRQAVADDDDVVEDGWRNDRVSEGSSAQERRWSITAS